MGAPPSLLSAWCPQGGVKSPLYLSTDALQHGHVSAGDFTFPGPSGFGHLQHPLSLSNPHFHLSRVSSRVFLCCVSNMAYPFHPGVGAMWVCQRHSSLCLESSTPSCFSQAVASGTRQAPLEPKGASDLISELLLGFASPRNLL